MTILARFRTRSAEDRRLLAAAAWLHICVAIGLRIAPFRSVRLGLRRLASRQARPERAEARVVWAVRTVAHVLPGATCLTEALVAKYFLPQPAHELRFGAAQPPAGGVLRAHAWIERDGRIIIGGDTAAAYHALRPAKES